MKEWKKAVLIYFIALICVFAAFGQATPPSGGGGGGGEGGTNGPPATNVLFTFWMGITNEVQQHSWTVGPGLINIAPETNDQIFAKWNLDIVTNVPIKAVISNELVIIGYTNGGRYYLELGPDLMGTNWVEYVSVFTATNDLIWSTLETEVQH